MSTFRHVREFTASPSEVFDAFRNPERLARWWGPAGFSSTMHTFEFRPGGAWLFTMHGPDGADYPNQSTFVALVPDALIRIHHDNPPVFDLTITLAPTPTGTHLTWIGVFDQPAFAEAHRAFLETANEQNLDRLMAELGRGGPGRG